MSEAFTQSPAEYSLKIEVMFYELLSGPIPWYVGGPLLGLMVPILYIIGNKSFGISSTYQHACAAILPKDRSFFNYDWKKAGAWNLKFAAGILIGGGLAVYFTPENYQVDIADSTVATLRSYGINSFEGFMPEDVFNWNSLLSVSGWIILALGGFLIGFGTRYGGGCTAGHGISGMADFQRASLIATISFFFGGWLSAYYLIPLIIQ